MLPAYDIKYFNNTARDASDLGGSAFALRQRRARPLVQSPRKSSHHTCLEKGYLPCALKEDTVCG